MKTYNNKHKRRAQRAAEKQLRKLMASPTWCNAVPVAYPEPKEGKK